MYSNLFSIFFLQILFLKIFLDFFGKKIKSLAQKMAELLD